MSDRLGQMTPRAALVAIWISWLLPAHGCGGSGGGQTCSVDSLVSGDGLALVDTCGRGSLRLLPAVRTGGSWLGAGRDGVCGVEDQTVVCSAGPAGRVLAGLDAQGNWRIDFEADQAAEVEGLALTGRLDLPGARAWLSNGFQSWSQSGALAISGPPGDQELAQSLAARGDAEVLRTGAELSWWHSWVAGGELALVAGVLDAETFKSWVRVFETGDGRLELWLVNGGAGEAVTVPAGGGLSGQAWFVRLGEDLQAMLSAYGQVLAARRRRPRSAAEAGWNSWYELFDGVDAAAVAANADLVRQILDPLIGAGTPLRIVIDDGWQLAWGEWQPNDKFPAGLDGLAADLHADGFEVGVWLAPLLVDEDAPLVADHPDWFVQGAVYNHSKHGPMRVLDVTQPDAAAHLAALIGRIVSWGIDLLKIDFLFAGTFEGGRYEPVTGMQAYQRALQIIRTAAGDDTVLVAVGAPGIPSMTQVDAWRLGGDIALEPFPPSWHFAANQARSISARWPVCLALQCDPDPPILRQLDQAEVGLGAWVVALAGGAMFLSDDLRTLPAERRAWLPAGAASAALAGRPAVPEDPVPAEPPSGLTTAVQDQFTGTNTQVLPSVWRLPDGRRLGLNLQDEPAELDGTLIPAHGAALLGQGP